MFSSAINWAFGKVQAYLATAGVIIAAVAYAFLKGRASGVKSSTDSIAKQTQKVNEKFQEIDSQRPDFDGAIGRLRQRSTKK